MPAAWWSRSARRSWSTPDGQLRAEWLEGLAADLAALRARGAEVLAVSSGAIALGRGILGLGTATLPLDEVQAAAAVGQTRLARAWERMRSTPTASSARRCC